VAQGGPAARPLIRTRVEQPSLAGLIALEERLDRLELLLQTLLRLLVEKKLIEREEFRQWIDYVDALDGSRDGKMRQTRRPHVCPACGRRSRPAARTCQYCGADLPARDFDEASKKGAEPHAPKAEG